MNQRASRSLVFISTGILVAAAGVAQKTTPTTMSEASLECIECHVSETAGIYEERGSSKHFRGNT